MSVYPFLLQGDIGLNVAQMIVELIRDNRKIVDRITRDQIEMFVGLLRQNKVSHLSHILSLRKHLESYCERFYFSIGFPHFNLALMSC